MKHPRIALGALAALGALYVCCRVGSAPAAQTPDPTTPAPHEAPVAPAQPAPADGGGAQQAAAGPAKPPPAPPEPLEPFVDKALDWLAEAQQEDGGWGGGSHSNQQVRDAHSVPTDPATTAVAAMALLRAGNGLSHGRHAAALRHATDHLLRTIEAAPAEGPQITDRTGTQPQAKMGQNVDTALAAQFLARLLEELDCAAEPRERVARALDKCLHKIQAAQGADGSWAAGGWAPVLQSAQMGTALELAQLAGRDVDEARLSRAREYQKNLATPAQPPGGGGAPASGAGTLDIGALDTAAAAGVPLYAAAANMRSVAAEARAAQDLVEGAKRAGQVPQDAAVDASTLRDLGVAGPQAEALAQSFTMNVAAKERAFDESLLAGFGNNGGEEFLSYQMKSESLAIDGGEEWTAWRTKMRDRLAKVQNQDGSWSGHHCITSPVFCTATAISCLTAGRDVEWLRRASRIAAR